MYFHEKISANISIDKHTPYYKSLLIILAYLWGVLCVCDFVISFHNSRVLGEKISVLFCSVPSSHLPFPFFHTRFLIFFHLDCFCLYQCVVNVISELQAQMRKFQQEITTRIQEQRALEGHPESPACDDRNAPHALDCSPDEDLCSSDVEDGRRHRSSGGDNVGGLFVLPWSSLHIPPYHHRLISISSLTLTSSPHSVKATEGEFLRFLASALRAEWFALKNLVFLHD